MAVQTDDIELKLPLGGMNVDVSSSVVDDDESPELTNVLLHEPKQLRGRYGWRREVYFGNLMAGPNARVHGAAVNKDRMIMSIVADPDAFMPPYYLNASTDTPPPGKSTLLDANSTIAAINGTVRPWTASQVIIGNARAPFSQPAPFEHATYFTSICGFTTKDRSDATVTGTRLCKWAGSTIAEQAVTASITLNATSGTLASDPGVDLTGMFIRFPADTSSSAPYSYQIATHSGTAFTLWKPYLGATKASQSASVVPVDYVQQSPEHTQCAIVHYDRVFVGRGKLNTAVGTVAAGEYPNMISWSEIAEADKWLTTSFILVDDDPNDAITGFAHVGRNLAVFKRERIYVLTGYDEQTFQITLYTADVGCVDSRSIVQYNGGCFFASEDGYHYFDGQALTNVTQSQPGHGITSAYKARMHRDNHQHDQFHRQITSAALIEDTFMALSCADSRTNPPEYAFLMALDSRAWSYFGNAEAGLQPVLLPANAYVSGVTPAVFNNFVAQLDPMVEDEAEIFADLGRYDQYYDSTGAEAQAYVPITIRFKDWEVYDKVTAHVLAMWVRHNIHYIGPPGTGGGFQIEVSHDPDLDEPVQLSTEVSSRYEDTFAPDKLYTTEIRDSDLAGQYALIRVTLTNTQGDGLTSASTKLYSVILTTSRARQGRVDNEVV